MTAIEFKDVSKRYGQRPVAEGLSFSIGEGERVVVHGPSGCGKTTVLRLVAGFIAPDTGQVLVGGQIPGPMFNQAKDGAPRSQSGLTKP